jgi:Fic family protein
MEKKFVHQDLILPNPSWGSSLVNNIIDLEKLRDKRLAPANIDIFWELKTIFHQLEIWASARIEGNQTELIDALDPSVKNEVSQTADYQELENLKRTIHFIDDYCKENTEVTERFILELHKRVVEGLPVGKDLPGDSSPGKLRMRLVKITQSEHITPIGSKVPEYMKELVEFINRPDDKKNDLLKIAIAHHRFTWIHPFNNGNGRVARLLTYTMLQLLGYGVARARILNPSAIFYANREVYYDFLAKADLGTQNGLLKWCDYFVSGLLEEINKIDRLLDDSYVRGQILEPVIMSAYQAGRISERENTILRYSLTRPALNFTSSDINKATNKNYSSVARSRIIKKMKESGLITAAFRSKQRYVVQLTSSALVRYVVIVLNEEGFIRSDPIYDEES